MTGKDGGHVSHGDTEETEAAGQARLAQREDHEKFLYLTYFLTIILWFSCGWNREPRGELLPSSLHRGDTENPWNFPVFSVLSVCSVVRFLSAARKRTTNH